MWDCGIRVVCPTLTHGPAKQVSLSLNELQAMWDSDREAAGCRWGKAHWLRSPYPPVPSANSHKACASILREAARCNSPRLTEHQPRTSADGRSHPCNPTPHFPSLRPCPHPRSSLENQPKGERRSETGGPQGWFFQFPHRLQNKSIKIKGGETPWHLPSGWHEHSPGKRNRCGGLQEEARPPAQARGRCPHPAPLRGGVQLPRDKNILRPQGTSGAFQSRTP